MEKKGGKRKVRLKNGKERENEGGLRENGERVDGGGGRMRD